jgi:hypothetical protein
MFEPNNSYKVNLNNWIPVRDLAQQAVENLLLKNVAGSPIGFFGISH